MSTRFSFKLLPWALKALAKNKEAMIDYETGHLYVKSEDGTTFLGKTKELEDKLKEITGGGASDGANNMPVSIPGFTGDTIAEAFTETLDRDNASSSKLNCVISTFGPINLQGLQIIDGISLKQNDRVLVRLQNNPSEQGIYLASSGNWTRALDADTASKLSGCIVAINKGESAGQSFKCLFSSNKVLGTDPVYFSKLSTAKDIKPIYGLTEGSGSAYTMTIDKHIADTDNLQLGSTVYLILHENTGTNPTLKINSWGAYPLRMNDGTKVFSGDANSMYAFTMSMDDQYNTIYRLASGGGGSGSSTIAMDTQVVEAGGLSSFDINIPFKKGRDPYFVIMNTTFANEGTDYAFNSEGTKIQTVSGVWPSNPNTTIKFIVFGNVDASIDILGSKTYTSKYIATGTISNNIPIGISQFNVTTDLEALQAYDKFGSKIFLNDHFTVSNDGLYANLVGWSLAKDDVIRFALDKKIRVAVNVTDGSLILNDSITNNAIAHDTLKEEVMAPEMKKNITGGVTGFDEYKAHRNNASQHVLDSVYGTTTADGSIVTIADAYDGIVDTNIKGESLVNVIKNPTIDNGTKWTLVNGTMTDDTNIMYFKVTSNGTATTSGINQMLDITYQPNKKLYVYTELMVGGTLTTAPYNIDFNIYNEAGTLIVGTANITGTTIPVDKMILSAVITINHASAVPGERLSISILQRYVSNAESNTKVLLFSKETGINLIDMGTSASDPNYNLSAINLYKKINRKLSFGVNGIVNPSVVGVQKNLFDGNMFANAAIYALGSATAYRTSIDGRNCLAIVGTGAVKCIVSNNFFKPSAQYSIYFNYKTQSANQYATLRVRYNDGTSSLLLNPLYNGNWCTASVTTAANKTVLKIDKSYTAISAEILYIDLGTFQIEEGTAPTAYAAYKSTSADYAVTLNKLDNGIVDEIVTVGADQFFIQRIKELVLTSDMLYELASLTNYNEIHINRPTDHVAYNKTALLYTDSQTSMIPSFNSGVTTGITADIGKQYLASTTWIALCVAKTRYADLAAVKSELVGTKILYQLASPIIRKVNAVLESNDSITTYYVKSASGMLPNAILKYPKNIKASIESYKAAIGKLDEVTMKKSIFTDANMFPFSSAQGEVVAKTVPETKEILGIIDSTPNTQTLNIGANSTTLAGDTSQPVDLDFTFNSWVNIVGTDGNCEDISKWSNYNSTTSLDPTNKIMGTNGIKITITSTEGAAFRGFGSLPNLDITKYYLVSVYVKNGVVGSSIRLTKDNTGGGIGISSTYITDTTQFTRVAIKIGPANMAAVNCLGVYVAGSVGQYGYFDCFMINEISAAEYASADTADVIATRYPYGESVVATVNPTVDVISDNLVRNGNCEEGLGFWSTQSNNGILTIEDGRFKLTSSAGNTQSWQNITVEANTNYYIKKNMTNGTTQASVFVMDAATRGVFLRGSSDGTFNTGIYTTISVLMYCNDTGTAYFDSIQLVKGTDAPTAYKSQKRTQTTYVGRFYKEDRMYTENSQPKGYKTIIERPITGLNYACILNSSSAGVKRIGIPYSPLLANFPINGILGDSMMVKYDGKMLKFDNQNTTTADIYQHNTGHSTTHLFMTIANADTGWTDAINPTVDEITAERNGWRAASNNGSRYNLWTNKVNTNPLDIQTFPPSTATTLTIAATNTTSITVADGSIYKNGDTICLYGYTTGIVVNTVTGNVLSLAAVSGTAPIGTVIARIGTDILNYCKANAAPGYPGDLLCYRALVPQTIGQNSDDYLVPIIGDMIPTLSQGANNIQYNTGLVRGEPVVPIIGNGSSSSTYAYINLKAWVDLTWGNTGNQLMNKPKVITRIYKNGIDDTLNWSVQAPFLPNYAFGSSFAIMPLANFNSRAIYAVDYEILDELSPSIGALNMSYSEGLTNTISKINAELNTKQKQDIALDDYIARRMYEEVATKNYIAFKQYATALYVVFNLKAIPKATMYPDIRVKDFTLAVGTVDVKNTFILSSVNSFDNSNFRVTFFTSDATTISNFNTYGINGWVKASIDCRGVI